MFLKTLNRNTRFLYAVAAIAFIAHGSAYALSSGECLPPVEMKEQLAAEHQTPVDQLYTIRLNESGKNNKTTITAETKDGQFVIGGKGFVVEKTQAGLACVRSAHKVVSLGPDAVESDKIFTKPSDNPEAECKNVTADARKGYFCSTYKLLVEFQKKKGFKVVFQGIDLDKNGNLLSNLTTISTGKDAKGQDMGSIYNSEIPKGITVVHAELTRKENIIEPADAEGGAQK